MKKMLKNVPEVITSFYPTTLSNCLEKCIENQWKTNCLSINYDKAGRMCELYGYTRFMIPDKFMSINSNDVVHLNYMHCTVGNLDIRLNFMTFLELYRNSTYVFFLYWRKYVHCNALHFITKGLCGGVQYINHIYSILLLFTFLSIVLGA